MDALRRGALAAEDAGEVQDARRLLDRALELDPRGPQTVLTVVRFRLRHDQPRPAQALLERTLKVLPENAELWAALGTYGPPPACPGRSPPTSAHWRSGRDCKSPRMGWRSSLAARCGELMAERILTRCPVRFTYNVHYLAAPRAFSPTGTALCSPQWRARPV